MNMNRLILVAFVGLTFILSCGKKKKDLIVIDINFADTTTLSTAIPALPVSLDFSSTPMQLDTFATKVDEYIGPFGFSKAQITNVKLKEVTINLENAPAQTFNFVKDSAMSLRVFVDSFSGTTPTVVAYKASVARNIKTLALDVQSTDIKDYFRSEYMKFLIAFRTQENEGLDGASRFKVNFTFTVTADPNL
jgi:hypothetical protein